VAVDGFWIDATEVTNAQFGAFVRATRYVTVAERAPDAKAFPGAAPELLVPGAVVFTQPKAEVPLDDARRWWRWQPGASWRHPEGPGSSIDDRADFPVVQVAWDDAVAYARWAGKRLPTEAEWERAARGGLEGKTFAWGDAPAPGGRAMANVWQGRFPWENTATDGFVGVAPVRKFPANPYGLYDVAGNVWEWVADWYRPDAYAAAGPSRNPRGPASGADPEEPGVAKRVMRGGSFLCSDRYCVRYKVAGRGKGAPDTGLSNLGFRCAKDARR
jgi:formylglycine-generating enzyme required for sulfatase activity